jgi:predicted nucleic acid-binding protein
VVFFVYLDASALVKRYVVESGTPTVNHLFHRVPTSCMVVLSVGLAEVISILIRQRNAGVIPPARFPQLIRDVRAEVGIWSPVRVIPVSNDLADQAFDLIDKHSINSTDAILLRSALDLDASLRASGHELLLVSSDLRLIRAAQAEGLATFNPEAQSAADLDAILGP